MQNSNYELLLINNATLDDSDPDVKMVQTEKNQLLADGLKQANPNLQVSRVEFLEIHDPQTANGIQITLREDGVNVQIPCWHKGTDAEAVWAEAWKYLELLTRQGDYLAFDPQIERRLDLKDDFDHVVASYSAAVDSQSDSTGTDKKRTWWRFW